MLPLVPFLLAMAVALVRAVAFHRGWPLVARWVTLVGHGLVLAVSLLLPALSRTLLIATLGPNIALAWDHAAQTGAAVVVLAVTAFETTLRTEHQREAGTLIMAMALLCVSAASLQTLAISLGLLCMVIIIVEGTLSSSLRSSFAVLGTAAVVISLSTISLFAGWSPLAQQSALPFFGVIIAIVFTLAVGGFWLGYPALRWPSVAALWCAAATALWRLSLILPLDTTSRTFMLVVGGIALLGSGFTAVLWGPRGRALDALLGMALGSALLGYSLDSQTGTALALLSLLGSIVSYSALIAMERGEGLGAYGWPRIIGVATLAGLLPGPALVVRWQLLSLSLAAGDGWLVFWQFLAALFGCLTAAMLLAPWLKCLRRSTAPTHWFAWAIGAVLAIGSLALGIWPGLVAPGLGWFGLPTEQLQASLALAVAPALLALAVSLSSLTLHMQSRWALWRERLRPVWQNSWENALLWIDQAQGNVSKVLRRGLVLLEERLLIVWSLFFVLVLMLIAEYGF